MQSVSPTELAYRVLKLEQKLESYRCLHSEELEQLRLGLAEVKEQLLALAAPPESRDTLGAPTAQDSDTDTPADQDDATGLQPGPGVAPARPGDRRGL